MSNIDENDKQAKTIENEGNFSGHRFRRMMNLNRKEPQTTASSSGGECPNSSERSSHSCIKSPEGNGEGDLLNASSLRTQSILDRSKTMGGKSYTLRTLGRSVGFGSDGPIEKEHDKECTPRSLKISILQKKTSLMGRLRGRGKEAQPSTTSACDKEDGDHTHQVLHDNASATAKTIAGSASHTTESMLDPQPSGPSDEQKQKSKAFVFLAPSDKGQEIALEEDQYYFHDPAQVHSLLTLPTFEDNGFQQGLKKNLNVVT